MIQMHQVAQCLLDLTSFVVNVPKRRTLFDIFDLSYGPNASNSTVFLLYMTSFVYNVHKRNKYYKTRIIRGMKFSRNRSTSQFAGL